MLHFAYGSNMSGAVMRRHARHAERLGPAALTGHRFIITADGYASVEPKCGATVHGMLWRLTARDRITLDLWEGIGKGLYRAEMLAVHQEGRLRPALVYRARPRGLGRPRSDYMELVVAAAQRSDLPPDYVMALQRWLPTGPSRPGSRKLGEFGWT